MIKNLTIEFNKKNIVIGILLIIMGIAAPIFINVKNFNVYEFLINSVRNNDKSLLIIAAFRLVILNSFRGLPHYLGAFLIAESTEFMIKDKKIPYVKGLITVIIIPMVYSAINSIHNIRYDLGVPAFTVIVAIVYLEVLNYSTVSFLKKSSVIVLLLMGVQWMDIIPELSHFKFGRGETSQDIKVIASFIGASDVLTMTAIMFFIIFTVNALLVMKLISDEHKIILATEENKRVEKELGEAKIKALEARNYIELKNLVHDLKTPLTSMQALVSVIELMEKDKKILLYLERIESSIDKLSQMISEILYEDKKNLINTEELFNFILSHISPLPYALKVNYCNSAKESIVLVNKIRVSRAIINALDNAYNAIDKDSGNININVYRDNSKIYIEVKDDGIGIEEEITSKVCERGFSTKNSTGLGLSFIESVINNHDGKIEIWSERSIGTCLKIILPEVMNYE